MGILQLVAKADTERKIAFKEESGFLLQQTVIGLLCVCSNRMKVAIQKSPQCLGGRGEELGHPSWISRRITGKKKLISYIFKILSRLFVGRPHSLKDKN